ncbi:MAG TPA: CHASE4 domain-containing protein, partial [Ideonella sp.]|nr:CHASE4 domain-containing protein [Ideonella sp.]
MSNPLSPPTRPASPASPPRPIWSASLVALVLCSAVLMPLAVIGSLVFMSHQQDQTALRGDMRRAETTLSLSRDNFTTNLIDYTTWDEAYRRLVLQLDRDWFDDSMGPGTYGTALHQDIVLLDAAGLPLRGALAGQVAAWSPRQRYGAAFARLHDEVAARGLSSHAAASYQWRNERLELLAVARVQPKTTGLSGPQDPARYLVMVRYLTPAVLASLATGVDLRELRAVPPGQGGAFSAAVKDDQGRTIA